MKIENPKIVDYPFLAGMYRDAYFPNAQVDKVKAILVELCARIEADRPTDAEAMLRLTHAATERINALAEEFEENGSELETGAREVMADDFRHIVDAYGFATLDIEDVIAPRDW